MRALEPPMAILAEVTHRCPLQCPYCSNPLELDRVANELDTESWCRVLDEAAALGVLQVHFSGGEPLVRRDLATLVERATRAGLYTNLITSAVLLGQRRLDALVAAGLDHVQISFQDVADAEGDRVAGYRNAQRLKREAAARVQAAGLPLTVNAVVHRQNLARLGAMIDAAVELGARRLGGAHG
jgi:PqqA peptide cyclase